MKSRTGLLSLGILLGICVVPQGDAATYNAAADFSTTENSDTSTWSYRYQIGAERNGLYPLLPAVASLGIFTPIAPDGWVFNVGGPYGYEVPVVGVNQTGIDVEHHPSDPNYPGFVWPADVMLVHPGPGGESEPQLVVVSWLSPMDMVLTIRFRFSDLDGSPETYFDGVNWFVERNSGADTLHAGHFDGGGTSGLRTLSDIAVVAGDRINFIIDMAEFYDFDSTSLEATITPVPEPAAVALFALGVPAVLAVCWRRKRAIE